MNARIFKLQFYEYRLIMSEFATVPFINVLIFHMWRSENQVLVPLITVLDWLLIDVIHCLPYTLMRSLLHMSRVLLSGHGHGTSISLDMMYH